MAMMNLYWQHEIYCCYSPTQLSELRVGSATPLQHAEGTLPLISFLFSIICGVLTGTHSTI